MEETCFEYIAKGYLKTPAYLFRLDMLQEKVELIRRILGPEVRLVYAMKANPFLVRPMEKLVEAFEVCSPGEYRICERAGVPMERIVLSGVYKEEKEIMRAVSCDTGKGTYTAESLQQIELLQKIAAEQGQVLRVLIRITSGNQFGVDEAEVREIMQKKESYPNLHLCGLQYYSGTQKKKMQKIRREMEHLDHFIQELKGQGNTVEELEYGPGFYVSYFEGDEKANQEAMLQEFAEIIAGMQFQGKITLEMGRYLAAECGVYLTSIVDQKVNNGEGYCIVDGGINHFNYYGQNMAMKIPAYRQYSAGGSRKLVKITGRAEKKLLGDMQNETAAAAKTDGSAEKTEVTGCEKWNVCGSLCTVGDVLVRQLPLKNAQVGDILVFDNLGAYSVTEGIYLFLSRDLPQIWFWSKDSGLSLVRGIRETDDLNAERM